MILSNINRTNPVLFDLHLHEILADIYLSTYPPTYLPSHLLTFLYHFDLDVSLICEY